MKPAIRYRPEIDGLRAVAVLPVVLFHAGLAPFSGGYVGVDVFFVISGYLITRLLITDLENGSFSLARFYERRARRILPALFFVAVLCLPFAWLWLMPLDLKDFAQSLVAVALFSSNILFYHESGYFGGASELKPLLHTWSLAVEEQYYILFPLLLALLWRFGRRRAGATLLLLAGASLGAAQWLAYSDPAAAFYLLPMRAWEILTGALGTLCLLSRPQIAPRGRGANALALVGLGLIAWAVIDFDATTAVPGLPALLPTTGALLVILYAREGGWTQGLLARRELVGLGLISYSAYLWHWPLMVFARHRLLAEPSPLLLAALGLAALPLAYVTWRFIEQPLRRGFQVPRRAVFTTAAGVASVFIALGISGHAGGGFPGRIDRAVFDVAASANDRNPDSDRCGSGIHNNYLPPERACTIGQVGNVVGVLWGDSHSDAIAPALGQVLQVHGLGLRHMWFGACPPAIGLQRFDLKTRCADYNDAALSAMLADPRLTNVVLAARFSLYLEGGYFDNGEGGVEGLQKIVFDDRDVGTAGRPEAQRRRAVAAHYVETIRRLLRAGKRVLLIYPIPEAGWNVPAYAAKRWLFDRDNTDITTSYEVFLRRNRATIEAFDSLGALDNLIRIHPQEVFCNSFVTDRCADTLGGKSLYRDDDHLSNYGASLLVDRIAEALVGDGHGSGVSAAQRQ